MDGAVCKKNTNSNDGKNPEIFPMSNAIPYSFSAQALVLVNLAINLLVNLKVQIDLIVSVLAKSKKNS